MTKRKRQSATVKPVILEAKNGNARTREQHTPKQIAALKPYQWPKGVSGNRLGRAVGSKPISSAYRVILDEQCPLDIEERFDAQGAKLPPRTWREMIAVGQATAAVKGYTPAAKEIADRVEGTVSQHVNLGTSKSPIEDMSEADLDYIVLTGELPKKFKQLESSAVQDE